MYTITDKREKKDTILFNDIEVGEFFYAQIFNGSCSELDEKLCLKVDKDNYFCFSSFCHTIDCDDYDLSITEIFNENNESRLKIIVEKARHVKLSVYYYIKFKNFVKTIYKFIWICYN